MVDFRFHKILKKFYSCDQLEDESVTFYSYRLEEIFDQAVQIKALKRSDVLILKQVFHAGLRKDLKFMSVYQFDRIGSYDDLKKEVRKLESDMSDGDNPEQKSKPCKAAVTSETTLKDMTEVKDLLKKLNEIIEKLEKEKEASQQQQQGFYSRGRGQRGRGRGYRGRGRGNYQPQRPIAGQNFQPTCWSCNEKGHLQRNCPAN